MSWRRVPLFLGLTNPTEIGIFLSQWQYYVNEKKSMKRNRILLLLSIFTSTFFLIFWSLDSSSSEPTYQRQLSVIDDRINVLEKDIKETQLLLETIKSYVRRLAASYERRNQLGQSNFNLSSDLHIVDKNIAPLDFEDKDSLNQESAKKCDIPGSIADVNIQRLTREMSFDNVDGGVWKQGFDIIPQRDRWTEGRPLQIFVVPHSHTDPGWVKTYMKYYETQTRNILDTMLIKLSEKPDRKFIYAEMAFFALWWAELNDGDRQKVRSLIDSKRLELVGGGWVMPDEAVTHYYGVLDQLQEGHSWLKRNLNLEINSSWAIDPFGHSPTIAYMQKMAGLQGGILQRVHYSIKKRLAHDKQLEFFWRQGWDSTGETDFLTHMMPFYSYDIPHTCGPNPSVCCQFDFNRLADVSKVRCPWNIPPVEISDSNVGERAAMLVDQYRKKAELFRTDSLFIPLGDDFRWETPAEWDAQMRNYGRLFEEINSHQDWNIKIRWGTLEDYFKSVAAADRSFAPLDSLTGDFFTYADRDQHYWSGYYTSRSFQKRFARVVENQQRSADILFSLAVAECNKLKSSKCGFPKQQLMQQLTSGRRNLALFQHHDGITGTAKDFVVEDYGIRLLSAFQEARYVQQVAASFLLLGDKSVFLSGEQYNVLSSLDSYATHDSTPEMFAIRPDEDSPKWIAVFNSVAWRRNTIVKLLVSSYSVSVINQRTGKAVRSESSLLWNTPEQASPDTYTLYFEVDIDPLGIELYRIEVVKNPGPMHSFCHVEIYNSETADKQKSGPFSVSRIATGEVKSAVASISSLDAEFDLEKGTLIRVANKKWAADISVEFVSYSAKETKERSGAYLFIPDENDPHPVSVGSPPIVRVSRGRLVSEIVSYVPMVEHRYLMLNISKGADQESGKLTENIMADILISNTVDIRGVQQNYELAMRIQTSFANKNSFYTDVNGFQMAKRERYDKLSIQGNFYPVTSAISIEDTKSSKYAENGMRLSLLVAQSAAGTSPKSGAVEVILDRRLLQDDNRGLGQPLKDNKRTELHYRLVLERRSLRASKASYEGIGHFRLTIPAHHYSLDLMYPMLLMPARSSITSEHVSRLKTYSPLGESVTFPCDLHLVSLRPLQAEEDSRVLPSTAKASTQVMEVGKLPILSLHRMLADEQCDELEPSSSFVVSTITKCGVQDNATLLSSLFSGSEGSFSKSTFEPVTISGRKLSTLLRPDENSLQKLITPGHVRSFLVKFA